MDAAWADNNFISARADPIAAAGGDALDEAVAGAIEMTKARIVRGDIARHHSGENTPTHGALVAPIKAFGNRSARIEENETTLRRGGRKMEERGHGGAQDAKKSCALGHANM